MTSCYASTVRRFIILASQQEHMYDFTKNEISNPENIRPLLQINTN